MKRRIYIETTVVSYLAARPSRDVIVLAHQDLTREWWAGRSASFDLCVSQPVLEEAGRGDPEVAGRRMALLRPIPIVEVDLPALQLARRLLAEGAVPEAASVDALHIAIAARHRTDYLLTWNCRHIANAARRDSIGRACLAAGWASPLICTPEELMED